MIYIMRYVIIGLAMMVAGCGPGVKHVWNKPGSDQATFHKERYLCMQEAGTIYQPMHRNEDIVIPNARGGVINIPGSIVPASANVNGEMFHSCMLARNWAWITVKNEK